MSEEIKRADNIPPEAFLARVRSRPLGVGDLGKLGIELIAAMVEDACKEKSPQDRPFGSLYEAFDSLSSGP